MRCSQDWSDVQHRRRLVWFFSVSDVLPLESPEVSVFRTDNAVDRFEDFSELVKDSLFLYIFAPDISEWSRISHAVRNTLHLPSEAGKGLSKREKEMLVSDIPLGFD